MRKPKVSPDGMSRQVRLLFETGLVKNLLRKELADFVGVPLRTLQNWFAGGAPQKRYEEPISDALARIEAAIPDPVMHELPSGAFVSDAYGRKSDPDDPAIVESEKFHAQMKEVFYKLQRKMAPEERQLLAQEEPAWTGFVEVLGLLKKHDIGIPRRKKRS